MRIFCVLILALFLVGTMGHYVQSQSLTDVVARARPSVVLVFSRLPGNHFNAGTGFIVSQDGYILTARHIFEAGGVPGVMLPSGTVLQATLAGSDSASDIAVLKVSRNNLSQLPLGNSSSLRLGEEIVVIGYPLVTVLGPREVTVTRGIISSIRESRRLLQIDAAVNPGNSGGPVLNSRGEVVGVVVARLREAAGVNFAVAINLARNVLTQAMGRQIGSPAPSPPHPSPIPLPGRTESRIVVLARGEPVVLAYWLVVEGLDGSLGIDSRRGIEIAIEDRGGSVLGHGIQLVGEDEGCSAQGGVRAATRIASIPMVVAAIGSSCSSAALPGAPILWNVRIPTISPSNTSPALTSPGRTSAYDGYLRVSHNDLVQGQVAARFVFRVLQARRVATIHDGSPYAQGLVAEFSRVFGQLGGTITGQAAVAPNQTDMRPVLGQLAQGRPEILYYPVFIAAGAFITRQSRETPGLDGVRLMGADGMFSPDFFRAAREFAMGMYFTSPDLSPEAFSPRYREFLEKHRSRFGEDPISAFHAHAYDATSIILAAIQKVARMEVNGGLRIDRDEVRNALFGTRGFQGLTGTLTCNPYGDCADPKIAVYQAINTDPSTWNAGVNPRKVFP